MAAINVASNGIVPEVLTDENYENWSDFLKGYLMGKGLWDVVTSSAIKSGDEVWKMKNAKALHAIKLSCGSKALPQIKKCETAEEAWKQLSVSFSSDLGADRDTELVGILDNIVGGNDNIQKLRRHVKVGDWVAAKSCIDEESNAVFSVCSLRRTILHIAVIAGYEEIVTKLMEVVQEKEKLLKMEDNCGYTALALAAKSTNNVRMAKCMVDVCKELLTMKTQDGEIPVLLASANGDKNMTRYLYSETPWGDLLEDQVVHYRGLLFARCISAEILDVALTLLQHNPSIPLTHGSKNLRPLYVLARMPSLFPSRYDFSQHFSTFRKMMKILENLEKRVSKMNESELKDASAYEAMLLAAENGIIEFVRSMSRANPDLLWAIDKNKRGVISYATLNRQLDILNLIHQSHKEKMRMISLREDEFGNNMLHLAAELDPSLFYGSCSMPFLQVQMPFRQMLIPFRQMQIEVLFFEEVEKMVHPKCKEARNVNGKKPRQVFSESHEELARESEKWVKGSASSFIIVGTLIMTIMFAAAFTVPGGYNQETGIPILLNRSWFKVFMIADAISLFLATTSVLLFVRILTSSFQRETDFVGSFPLNIQLGARTLFLSVLSMIVAFCAALSLILKGERNILVAATVFASLPVWAFLKIRIPHYVDFRASAIEYYRYILLGKYIVYQNINRMN